MRFDFATKEGIRLIKLYTLRIASL